MAFSIGDQANALIQTGGGSKRTLGSVYWQFGICARNNRRAWDFVGGVPSL